MKNITEQYSALLSSTIYFDENDFLREKFSNPLQAIQFIDKVEQFLEKNNSYNTDNEYFLYGVLGNFYRISGQPKKAIYYLRLALEHAIIEKNAARRVVSYIRLGEALKYNNHHEKALNCFSEAMKIITDHSLDQYKDFFLQHQGKCLIEMKRWNEAEQCLSEALTIRKLKGNSSLIESTEKALQLLEGLRS